MQKGRGNYFSMHDKKLFLKNTKKAAEDIFPFPCLTEVWLIRGIQKCFEL